MAVSEPAEPATAAAERPTRTPGAALGPSRSTRGARRLYRLPRVIVIGMLRLWFRPRVRGRANMPAEGPAIIAPVHRSNVDFGFAALLTHRKLFFMAKEELWKSAWFGRLLESLGVFPVHRSGTDRESVRRAEEVLHSGRSCSSCSPRGPAAPATVVEDLAEGVAFLAARTGAPIVPVGIGGSERAMPKGAKFPKPIGITVSIGEPIDGPSRGRKASGSPAARSTS